MKNIINLLFTLLLITSNISAALVEETAVITHIADGDTFDVRFSGETEDERIRFIGIQTMEIHPTAPGTPNDCWADEATQRLTELTGGVGATVILRSKNPTLRVLDNRLQRHVFVVQNGQEINIVKTLIQEGLAFSSAFPVEDTYNKEYEKIAQNAKEQGIGVWSTENHCPTPAYSSNTSFKILVHYDANGNDDTNLNDEWVKIKNTSGKTVDISNWWLRDSALNFFRFPSNTILLDNKEILIRGGNGINTDKIFYWGNTHPIFDNIGDGAYLVDYLDDSVNPNDDIYPKGNIKASFNYPCIGTCNDTLQGKVKIVAHYDAQGNDDKNLNGEWIRITNTSNSIIDLKNYIIHSAPEGSDNYVFTDTTPLNPNESLYLYIGNGTDSPLKKYWHKNIAVLANDIDKVWLDTLDNRLIAEFSWPAESNTSDVLDDKVKLDVRYDAEGDDDFNLNGEWVRITNTSSINIDLKDYILSSAPEGSDSYYFAQTTILHPDEELFLYTGTGEDSLLKKYWGKIQSVHANAADKVWLHTLDNHTIAEVSWPSVISDTLVGKIEMSVNYDAEGDDNQNINGEWIKITNTSGNTINLKDYLITSAPKGSDSYWFKTDTPLATNEILYLYVGQGTDTALKKYWGKTTGILANAQDKVSLINLSGSIIIEQMWPCVGSCTDPLQGKIKLQAHYDANGIDDNNLNDEWIRITNISTSSLDLKNYIVHSEPVGSVSYTFNLPTVLDVNETLYLYTGEGSDTAYKKYWGKTTSVLANASDRVWVDTNDGILITEHSWPCIVNCDESLKDKISIVAHYDAQGIDDNNLNDEWVRITNKSNETINLKDHVIHSMPLGSDNYVFLESNLLNAGESLYLHSGIGISDRLNKYWGKTTSVLANAQDKVWIDTLAGYKIAEFSWPNLQGSPLSSKIKIIANYDAEGNDITNPNGEWIRITNTSVGDINLKDYLVHSLPEGSDHYLFNQKTILHAHEDLFLYIGTGNDTRLKKYWGKTSGILANDGDKVWLSTLDGINIKEFVWPCVENCTDTLNNKIIISARYDADGDDNINLNGEWVRIYNQSDNVINLKDYTINSAPIGSDRYTFMENTILGKGESLYLYSGSGSNTNLQKYWNKSTSVLANASDRVWLSSFDGQTLSEFTWPCEGNCTDNLIGKLSLSIQYDALGGDDSNPNGEWITINNLSDETVNLKDYILHMNSRSYYFMHATYIPAKEYIRVFVGEGIDTETTFYWNNTSGILINEGGEVSISNNRNKLIVKQNWPCTGEACVYGTPMEIVSVNYDAIGSDDDNPNGEWIILKNTSGTKINLRNWEITVRGYQHHFMNDFILNPNTEIQIFMGQGNNNSTKRYWGLNTGVLRNGGDIVKILNPQRIISHCSSWGSEANTCSNILDSDHDGILNTNDTDDDNDGTLDTLDAFPLYSAESADTDSDGLGDNYDNDDDNDGISDEKELNNGLNPLDPLDALQDSDGDGITNRDEINAGSDPKDRNDPIKRPVVDDYNQNHIADILWRKDNINHLWYMQADGSHTYKNIGTKSTTYTLVGTGDLNGDGITDILWKKGVNNYIWYMHEDGSHAYKQIDTKSYTMMGIADFNNDGIDDILWRKDNINHLWYMQADGSHTYKNIGTKSTTYTLVGTGDLNGDGITDILWKKGVNNYIWYMHEDGSHAYKQIDTKSYTMMGIADFNNDGIDDILWRKDNINHLWYMQADGSHTYKNIGTKSTTYTLAKIADYNGDGITDILWRKGYNTYIWYMHQDGGHDYKKVDTKGTAYAVQ